MNPRRPPDRFAGFVRPFDLSWPPGTAIVVLALVAAGCGLSTPQRAAVRNFSEATSALGEVTGRELIQMRNDNIEMNQRRLALAKVVGSTDKPGSLEGQFTVDAVTERVKATETIRTYGDLLQALVDDTQEKELQGAADRFTASVRGLPAGNRALKEEQIAALGRLVQAAGGLIVEAKKRAAVKQIVPDASTQIDRLCDLLANDFDPDQPRLSSQYLKDADLLSVDADTAARRATDAPARVAATEALALAQAGLARRDTLIKTAREAVIKLKAANRALAEAVDSDEVTREDLISYATTVQSLVETAKVLQ